jgi:hypothetical protein
MLSAVRRRLLLGIFVFAVTAPIAVGPRAALAHVFTDQLDYAPGSTVIISGDNSNDAGYLPAETVLVDVSGPNGYAASCEGIADLDGAWSCAVVLSDSSDAIGTYVYTASGLDSGVFESGVFTDATLVLFEDAAFTTQRNAFEWGETIHARGTALIANRCARIQWKKPDASLAEPAHEIVASAGGTVADSFTVPSTGPSGIWTATLQQGSTVGTCAGSSFTTVGQSIQIFDVARVVIVGAGSPSTLVADNPGGDNFVDQQPAQINTVQGPGGVGTTLNVLSRVSTAIPGLGLNQRTFLRFDLAGAGIPAIGSITDATLRLRGTKSPTGCTLPRTYDLHTVDPMATAWNEGAITWNNKPGVVGTPSSLTFSALPADLYLRFDVDDHVEDFVGGVTNNGWQLRDRTEDYPGTGCDSRFASTEANASQKNLWPVLLIDYDLDPLVSNSSLCTFDVNEDRDGHQFRLIFTPDQPNSTSTSPRWKLNASNPGQFYFNVFVVGTPDEEETITLTLPYPFVTQGAQPVHVFDGATVVENGALCLVPGNAIAASASPETVALSTYTTGTTDVEVTFTFPSSGFAYIAIHLNYGLKHVAAKCFPDNKTDVNVTCELPSTTLIPNHGSYDFSFSNTSSGTVTVENENVVKNDPGIAGLVTQQGSGDPVANVMVQIYDSKGKKLATVYTDADGWYQWTYKYTGKPATFWVNLPGYALQQSVTLKSNAYVIVNFMVP